MAFGRKKTKEELTSGDLSAEFFGDGSTVTPGQDQAKDDSANLFEAITGSKETKTGEADAYSLYDTGKRSVDPGPDYIKSPSWFAFGGGDNPEVNPYAAEQDRRYSLDPRTRKVILLVVLTVVSLLLGLILPSISYNTDFSLTFQGILGCIKENVGYLLAMITGANASGMQFKVSAYLVACLAGLALATTGAVYQGAFKNALVSPTTLGINSGASVGVAIFALLAPISALSYFGATTGTISMTEVINYYDSLDLGEYLLITEGRAFASLVGCFIVVALVMLVSHLVGKGKSSSYALIICGQVVALVANSVVEMIRYYVIEVDESGVRSSAISSNQGGMAAGSIYTFADVLFMAIPVIICLVIIMALRRKMNVLAFNDEEARSMGIATQRLRWVMVMVCTVMTAVVLSFSGNTAFIGLAVPLIARRYVGPNLRYLMPASAAMGCLFMTFTYWFTDLDLFYVLFRIDLPVSVNVITSIIGAVLFAFMALSQRKENRSADWI